MSRYAGRLLVALLVAMVACSSRGRAEEPSYRDRPLGDWVEDLYSGEAAKRDAAFEAIRMIGKDAVEPLMERLTDADDLDDDDDPVAAAVGGIGKLAVPLLLKYLTDRRTSARRAGAIAAGYTGKAGARAIRPLAALARNGREDERVRGQAIQALGRLAKDSKSAVTALVSLFPDEEWGYDAGEVLVPVGKPALKSVVAVLKHRSETARDVAATTLGDMGKPILADLVKLLRSSDARLRAGGALAISYIGEDAKTTHRALVALTRDKKPEVRGSAIRALGSLGGKETESCLEIFVTALKQTQSDEVSEAAAVALGKVGKPAVPYLVASLKTGTVAEQQKTCEAISRIGPAAGEAVPALVPLLDSPNQILAGRAVTALGRIGPAAAPAVPRIAERLEHDNEYVRAQAATALGGIGGSSAPTVPKLRAALEDRSDEVRRSAAGALGKIGKASVPAIPDLLKLLDEKGAFVRQSAIQALVLLGKEGVEGLAKAFEGEARKLRGYLNGGALGSMSHEGAIPSLAEALREGDPPARRLAAWALGFWREKGKSAVEALEAATRDPDTEVQRAAEESLGRIRGRS